MMCLPFANTQTLTFCVMSHWHHMILSLVKDYITSVCVCVDGTILLNEQNQSVTSVSMSACFAT